MRSLFIFFIGGTLLMQGCKPKSPTGLGKDFLLSLQKNDFELLNPYLPDVAFYKSLGNKMPSRTDKEIKSFLAENNESIKVAWQNTLFNAAEKKIDFNKVALEEVISYDPFKKDKESEAMIIKYTYNNQTWDDIQFIISRLNNKTYLLAIPNPTRAFSFSDPSLRASEEAKLILEMEKPAFKKLLEKEVKKIMASVKENNIDAFATHLVYRGADENRKWKSGINLNDSLERLQALDFMGRVSRSIEGCEEYRTGELNTERESEGNWIILPAQCANKTVQFAFLKIGDKLMLGDIDAR